MGDGKYHPAGTWVRGPDGKEVADTVAELNKLRAQNQRLKREIAIRDGDLHEKNLKLTAMHYVWSTSGHHSTPISADLVARILLYAKRLYAAWPNYNARGETPRAAPVIWEASWKKLDQAILERAHRAEAALAEISEKQGWTTTGEIARAVLREVKP